MKALFFLLFFQVIATQAFCQADSASLKIMEEIFRREQPKETLFYTDRVRSEQIKMIKESFRKREYSWWKEGHIPDTIRLSKSEKMYLDSSIDKLAFIRWNDSLFENSNKIPLDSMWSHQRYRYEECLDTTVEGNIVRTGDYVTHTNVFSFSYPIYIREKTVFLLYFIRRCIGDCGIDELYFYRKENGVYKKWILVDGGAF